MSEETLRNNEISKKYGDPWIWGIYFLLVIISLIESYSASSREIGAHGIYGPVIKQGMFLAIGAVLIIVLCRVNYYKKLFRWIMVPGLAFFTTVALAYVMFFGDVINGARRAITMFGFSLQPSEFAKLSIVTIVAYVLSRSQRKQDVSWKGVIMCVFMVAVYGALMFQSGLTNTLILMTVSFALIFICGTPFKKIFIIGVAFIVIIGGVYWLNKQNDQKAENLSKAQIAALAENKEMSDSLIKVLNAQQTAQSEKKVDRSNMRWKRIIDFLDAANLVYKDSVNPQELYSRMAQAHGGMWGVMPGNSRECSRLPLAFSDYIFSIIVEEMGFVGGMLVIFLFVFLLLRVFMLSRKCRRAFPTFLLMGMATMTVVQALVHIAINVGAMPVSGQPLPLISVGGTAIVVQSISFGVMLSISRTIANNSEKENKKEDKELPDNVSSENPLISYKNEWK